MVGGTSSLSAWLESATAQTVATFPYSGSVDGAAATYVLPPTWIWSTPERRQPARRGIVNVRREGSLPAPRYFGYFGQVEEDIWTLEP